MTRDVRSHTNTFSSFVRFMFLTIMNYQLAHISVVDVISQKCRLRSEELHHIQKASFRFVFHKELKNIRDSDTTAPREHWSFAATRNKNLKNEMQRCKQNAGQG